MTKAGFWLNTAICLAGITVLTAFGAYFGYKWLAFDEPDSSYHCGSGSRGGLCFRGEWTNMFLTFLCLGLVVTFTVLCVRSVRHHRAEESETHRRHAWSATMVTLAGNGVVLVEDGLDATRLSQAERLHLLEALRFSGAVSEAEYQRQQEEIIPGN